MIIESTAIGGVGHDMIVVLKTTKMAQQYIGIFLIRSGS